MTTAFTTTEDFFGQAPLGEKTAILLANPQQAQKYSSVNSHSPICLRNEYDVSEFVSSIRKENRSHKLSALMDTVTHFVIQQCLPPSGTTAHPFPWFSRSSGPFHNLTDSYIEIHQNKVSTKTISELQSQFRSASAINRPKIIFVIEDREKAHSTFSKLNSASDVFAPTPAGVRRVDLPDVAASDFERIYFTRFDNHRSAALATLPETDDKRIDFINELILIKSQKIALEPTHLLPKLKSMSDTASKRLGINSQESRHFWTSAWIHTLMEQAYIQEYAKLEVQTAIGLSSMINEPGLASHVLRFSNQVFGTNADALAYLKRGRQHYESLSPNSYSHLMYTPSYLGLLQNYHVTELYQSERSDPTSALTSYEFAKQEAPYFTNLAMLGNAAAMGYLTNGNTFEAIRIYDKLLLDNADEIDRWSITCNRLIAIYEAFGYVDKNEIILFSREISEAQVSKVWEYHLFRFALNLIQIDKENHVKEIMWDLIKSTDYFDSYQPKKVEDYQRVIITKDFYNHSNNGRLTGQMGEFVERTGIFPSTDFDWT